MIKKISWCLTSLLIAIFASINIQKAYAASTFIDGITGSSCASTSAPVNQGYAQAITAGSSTTLTTIKIAVTTTHVVSSDAIKIYSSTGSGGSTDIGTLLATFTYSSSSGIITATNNYFIETFTGSFAVTSGVTYFIQMYTSAGGGYDCYDTNTPSVSAGWNYFSSGGSYYWSWPGRGSSFAMATSHMNFIIIGGPAASSLSTPTSPIVSSIDGTHISVSLGSNDANASSYLISVYRSDGVTVFETSTATTSGILGVNSLPVSPAVTYKVGVTAIGDGINYLSSNISSLTSFTTPTITTTITLTKSSISANFRITFQLLANLSPSGSDGKVTFLSNGKKIPNCISLTSISLSATCNWKPSSRGLLNLTATLIPTNSGYQSSLSNTLNVFVNRRTGNR